MSEPLKFTLHMMGSVSAEAALRISDMFGFYNGTPRGGGLAKLSASQYPEAYFGGGIVDFPYFNIASENPVDFPHRVDEDMPEELVTALTDEGIEFYWHTHWADGTFDTVDVHVKGKFFERFSFGDGEIFLSVRADDTELAKAKIAQLLIDDINADPGVIIESARTTAKADAQPDADELINVGVETVLIDASALGATQMIPITVAVFTDKMNRPWARVGDLHYEVPRDKRIAIKAPRAELVAGD